MTSEKKFTLGINYWPRRKAMFWWADFDPGEVREEFTVIQETGLSLVRIFLLWEAWQPALDSVNPAALDNLETVANIAAELGLQLDITFFTGHMSGPSWVPGWLLRPAEPMPPRVNQVVSGGKIVDCGYANPFSDPAALRAEELLLRTVVSRLNGHPAVGLWNLGNEPDLFAWPPNPAAGREWVRRMAGIIRQIDARTPITCGLHVESLVQDNGLRVNDVFAEVDVAVMHGYPMYANWADGPLDLNFVPFLCALTTALSGKPTLMEEFGACTVGPGQPSAVWEWTAYGKPRSQFMASEAVFAAYLETVLAHLHRGGAAGAMLWCYADYVPELYDRPPCLEARHERFFGLVRPNGSLKPHAEVIRKFAVTQPAVRSNPRPFQLDISAEEYYARPLHHARRLYQQYLSEI